MPDSEEHFGFLATSLSGCLLDGCPGRRFGPAAYTLTGLPYERSPQCLLSWSAMDCWQHGLTANLTGDLCDGYELDERGRVVRNQPPSARRQIAATDIYCQLTEQLGHLAGMSVVVTTPSSGIRVPDVVWLPPGNPRGL